MKHEKITIICLVLLCCSLAFMGCKDTTEEKTTPDAAEKTDQQIWTCSMHPEIQETEAGECKKCNMKLILKD